MYEGMKYEEINGAIKYSINFIVKFFFYQYANWLLYSVCNCSVNFLIWIVIV